MDQRTTAHQDTSSPFKFGLHPFFTWMTATIDKFLGSWQGGPYNHWPPCGSETIDSPCIDAFGHHLHSTTAKRELGIFCLESIIEVLYHHVLWVDATTTRLKGL